LVLIGNWLEIIPSGSIGIDLSNRNPVGQIGQIPYYLGGTVVRGTPYASDTRPSSASAPDSCLSSASTPATSSLFRNAFGRMTSYATRSRPASAPDRMMSHDVA